MTNNKALRLISLDEDLLPTTEANQFHLRQIIFSYKEHWYYRLGGELQTPNSSARYSTYHDDTDTNEQVWAISKDVLKLLKWKQDQKT